jgi:hypothetical protein
MELPIAMRVVKWRHNLKNNFYMKSHQNNSKTFEELTYAEQAKSISAQILSLERAIIAHKRRAAAENRNVTETHTKLVEQVERLLNRINNQDDIL